MLLTSPQHLSLIFLFLKFYNLKFYFFVLESLGLLFTFLIQPIIKYVEYNFLAIFDMDIWGGLGRRLLIQLFTSLWKDRHHPLASLCPSFIPPLGGTYLIDELSYSRPWAALFGCSVTCASSELACLQEHHCSWPCTKLNGKGSALGGEAGRVCRAVGESITFWGSVLAHFPQIQKAHSSISILLLMKIFWPSYAPFL